MPDTEWRRRVDLPLPEEGQKVEFELRGNGGTHRGHFGEMFFRHNDAPLPFMAGLNCVEAWRPLPQQAPALPEFVIEHLCKSGWGGKAWEPLHRRLAALFDTSRTPHLVVVESEPKPSVLSMSIEGHRQIVADYEKAIRRLREERKVEREAVERIITNAGWRNLFDDAVVAYRRLIQTQESTNA